MSEKILPENIRELKINQDLFRCIPCNVFQIGNVGYMDVYSCPSIKYLLQIVYRLPDDITADILNNCFFIFPIRDHGMHIPSTRLKGRNIIVFNSFNSVEEKTIFKIMLHEIAHSYLKHYGPKTHSENAQREKDASEWADRMLEIVY